MILLLALLAALPEDPAAAPSDGWKPIDGVAAVVNDEIVKESELQRLTKRLIERRQIPISTSGELDYWRELARQRLVLDRLEGQAGLRLGLAEEEVERIVESHLAKERKRVGLLAYVGDLEQAGLEAGDVQRDMRLQFYRDQWTRSVVGEETGAKRPRRDRFVRPGEMRYLYGELRELLGEPAEVRLEYLSLVVPEDGAEAAAEEAEALLSRAERGESLLELSREVGLDRCQSRVVNISLAQLDPALRDFAARAPRGSLSDLFPFEDGSSITFFRLVDRREAGPPLPFLDRTVQDELESRVLTSRDGYFLQRSRSDLIRSAYLEPPLSEVVEEPEAAP